MQIGSLIDLYDKQCPSCDKPLIGDIPVPLVWEGEYWYHEPCLLRAKRALAVAMKLAHLGYAIAEYVAYRDNLLDN